MRESLFFIFAFMLHFLCHGQPIHLEIAAISTHSEIDLDYTEGDTVKHQIFVNQFVPSRNKLLVFLPGTGGRPKDHYSEFCKTAANEGYHVIGLVYKNITSISSICGTMATADTLCSENARMEIIYGTDLSQEVEVDAANSILNRLTRLLYYLASNYPAKGWEQYIDATTMSLHWENIALAGHSQGGGHAALIARDNIVNRVLFFNCPSDANLNIPTPLNQPSWFYDPHITPDSCYYAFYHQQNGGANRLAIYNLFGLGNYGEAVNVDITSPDYNYTHILYSDSTSFDYDTYINHTCDETPPINPTYNPHSDIIIDCEIPRDVFNNNPYEEVWQYMLTNDVSLLISAYQEYTVKNDDILVYPNPTSGVIHLAAKNEKLKLSIYSSAGVLIGQYFNEETIDISAYPAGIYILDVLSEQGRFSKLLLKK